MANYIEMFRSNKFRVKNINDLQDELDEIGYHVELVECEDGSVKVLSSEDEEECFGHYWGENFDYLWEWETELPKHLEEGSVAVFQVIGWEKMRYLTGYSVAIDSEGVVNKVNLDDIYDSLPVGTDTAEY